MSIPKNVLVIGGGIGGLSTAIALHNKGIPVEVVELNKDWKVYHVGIVVSSNFVRAMAALGVAKEAVEAGYAYKGWRYCDINGKVLKADPGVATAGPEFPADLGLTRPALHKVLTDRVRALGIPVRLGVTFTDIEQTPDHVIVQFTDGTKSTYDIVVGADGNYSKVRKALFGDRYAPKFTGQGTWRYNVPRPPEQDWAEIYTGHKDGKAGYIPLTPDTMYIFCVVAEPGNPFFAPGTLAAEFRKRLDGYGGRLGELAKLITDPSLVVYRPLEACVLPAPWYKGRVILIGDAAHSATPHLGQGAAMALEDSVVLGEALARDVSLTAQFGEFMTRRYTRAKFIAESSIQLGEWEMHPAPDADPIGLSLKARQFIAQPI